MSNISPREGFSQANGPFPLIDCDLYGTVNIPQVIAT